MNPLRCAINKIRHARNERWKRVQILRERAHETLLIQKNVVGGGKKLEDGEKHQILELWGAIATPRDWGEYEIFKRLKGFDARYLSHELYLPLIARRLNDYHYSKLFEDKSLLGRLGIGVLRFPYCYVRCINGEYYDDDLHQISDQQVINICATQDELIWKPSRNSSGGRGIERLCLKGKQHEEREEAIKRLLTPEHRNFVIQQRIHQHPSMAVFNETSINTLRMTTLYLNGLATCVNLCLRIGRMGAFVDNFGAGGCIVGVHPDGSLYGCGYLQDGTDLKCFNGINFQEQRLEFIPALTDQILEEHKNRFSLCKFIGWDVCIAADGKPVVIEVNTSQPGLFGEQLCCGPIFGDRTEEVINYINKKNFQYD